MASDSSGTPSARRPFHVNASVTQRSELSIVACASAADCDPVEQFGQPRPAAGGVVERQELVAAGHRRGAGQQDVLNVVELKHQRTAWRGSLHLVEHVGERRFQPQRLLDLVGRDVRVLAVLQEAGVLMLADELDEGFRVGPSSPPGIPRGW